MAEIEDKFSGTEKIQICAICRDENVSCNFLTRCNHSFHKECIETWLNKLRACPYCRKRISKCAVIEKVVRTGLIEEEDLKKYNKELLEKIIRNKEILDSDFINDFIIDLDAESETETEASESDSDSVPISISEEEESYFGRYDSDDTVYGDLNNFTDYYF